jgi:hypothetical protein
LDERQAWSTRHSKINDRKFGWGEFELFDRFVAVFCDDDAKSPFFEGFGQSISEDDAIVDEHDARYTSKAVWFVRHRVFL